MEMENPSDLETVQRSYIIILHNLKQVFRGDVEKTNTVIIKLNISMPIQHLLFDSDENFQKQFSAPANVHP